MNIIEHVGSFTKLMKLTLTIPDRWSMFGRQYVREIMKLGIDSIFLDIIISLFIGMAITIQMKLNMSNPILPGYLTGLAVRDTLLLEFSPTILCLILAGIVGSNIASEIVTMRITEQIDAIDIMGINSANYLILPKITAFISVIPSLVIISIFAGILGGLGVAEFTDTITVTEYTQGIQYSFVPFYVTYAIIKSMVFAFIISSVASYYGYTVKGGALEVGKNSTKAVVNSSIIILGSNFMLTKLLLT